MFTLEKLSNDESHPDYIPSMFARKKTNQLENSNKIGSYNSVKRCASSNLANSSKTVMFTDVSDQPSVSDVKPEPVFIGPENIAGPDPVAFRSYCSVSDYAVGTDADELVSPKISSGSSQILSPTIPKLLSESAAAPRLSMSETPIKPDMTQCSSSTPIISNKSLLMEMDFLRSEKILLQKRIKCLEEQVCIFSFIVYKRNKKFSIKVSDKTFFLVSLK